MASIAKTVRGQHVLSLLRSGDAGSDAFKGLLREHVIWIARRRGVPLGASATKAHAIAAARFSKLPTGAPKMRGAAKKKRPAAKRKAAPKKRAPAERKAAPKKRKAPTKKKAASGSKMVLGSAEARADMVSWARFPQQIRERETRLLKFFARYNSKGVCQTASSTCRKEPKTRKAAEAMLRRHVVDRKRC